LITDGIYEILISKPIDLKVNIISYGSLKGKYFTDYNGNRYTIDENNSFTIKDLAIGQFNISNNMGNDYFILNYLEMQINNFDNIKKDEDGNCYANIQMPYSWE
jgi:hypothetical protein